MNDVFLRNKQANNQKHTNKGNHKNNNSTNAYKNELVMFGFLCLSFKILKLYQEDSQRCVSSLTAHTRL